MAGLAESIWGTHEALVPSQAQNKQGVVMNICNPSAWEVGRQENQEFKVNLGNIVRFRLAWATRDPALEQNKDQDRNLPGANPIHHLSCSLPLVFPSPSSTYTLTLRFLNIFVRSLSDLTSQQGPPPLRASFLPIPSSSLDFVPDSRDTASHPPHSTSFSPLYFFPS